MMEGVATTALISSIHLLLIEVRLADVLIIVVGHAFLW